jgi:hypothetical protein
MLKHALGSAMSALSILASVATGQLASSDQPIMPRGVVLQQGAPTGPASAGPEFVPAPFLQSAGGLSTDITMSALMQPERQLQGGVVDTRTSVVPVGGGDGGVIQYIDQPYTCDNAFYSNSNHNTNPYLTFEDFVADGSPLRNVKFYGGTTGDMFADVNYIGIEIWSIQSGGECGWTYASLQGLQIFTLAELNPSYVCDVVGAFPSYEMLANFSSPIALNAGQNYMITIYAGLNNPDGNLYFWNQSTVNNYNPSSSWDRNTGSYVRCGPDAAFSTNVNGSCFDQACSANTAYYSNYVNNTNPYIVADDFTAGATGDLRQLQFNGGAFDSGVFAPTNLGNIAGFYIELYTIQADGGSACGSYLPGFLGAYQVSMANARPRFHCVDQIGMTNYQFTVTIPAGQFPLTAGTNYALGVYGIPADPNSTELFCWASTDALYGLPSWSYNINTGVREVCHSVDQAFCIDGDRPCLGDYDNNGVVNTIDVLRFLNDWAAGSYAADCNGDGTINTQDVLCFLNRWAAGC